MKNDILVSIVMPCYNVEEYVEETIKSLLNQEYKNIEIIIINDGSTDNTEKKIKKFLGKDNIIYVKQKNKGVSNARNKGIELAKGKYISFIDGDDLYHKKKILLQIKEIMKKNKKVCYCGTEVKRIDENRVIKVNEYYKEGKILIDYILQKAYITTNDWLIELNLIKRNKLKFNENIKYGEDSNFFMKIITLEQVICVKEILTTYRVNYKSSSYNKEVRVLSEENYITDYIEWFRANRGIYVKEFENVQKILNKFLLPLVTLKNINFNRQRRINKCDKKILNQFKFNFRNIKTSIKFYLLLIKNRKNYKEE